MSEFDADRPPPVRSMSSWCVSQDKTGQAMVTFALSHQEARDWAVFLATLWAQQRPE